MIYDITLARKRNDRLNYWLTRLKGFNLYTKKHYNSSFGGFTLKRDRWIIQIKPGVEWETVFITYLSHSDSMTGPWFHTYSFNYKPGMLIVNPDTFNISKKIDLIVKALIDNSLLPLCINIHPALTDIAETALKEL